MVLDEVNCLCVSNHHGYPEVFAIAYDITPGGADSEVPPVLRFDQGFVADCDRTVGKRSHGGAIEYRVLRPIHSDCTQIRPAEFHSPINLNSSARDPRF